MSFIVAIEGIDGSGKGTQAAALNGIVEHSKVISFPQYKGTFYGSKIGDFLNGKFGGLNEVHPLLASLLYAGDRKEYYQDKFDEDYDCNDMLIYDRFVASNIAHQGAKVDGQEREDLIAFIKHAEFMVNPITEPDVTVYLNMPVEYAVQLIAKKNKRSYTDKAADIHEADTAYLQRVKDIYDELAKEDDWITIDCVDESGIRPEVDITHDIALALEEQLLSECSHIKIDRRKLYAKDSGS